MHGLWLWRYLYRAIDRSGALVDVMFSERRDMAAAKAFFEQALMVAGVTPDRSPRTGMSYPRAIRTVLGTRVRHRNSQDPARRVLGGRYPPGEEVIGEAVPGRPINSPNQLPRRPVEKTQGGVPVRPA